MIERVEALARRWEMLPEGARVLAAVSGGVDSMCLLHWLWERGAAVSAAHYNHRMRGAAADEDEAYVRDWCRARDIPFYVGSGDVYAIARETGCSVEVAGRTARYAFLERVADEIGADRIATAHHASDNAETVLFHLVRGTGPGGLGGIAPVRGRLIRPLLAVTRTELEDYAREKGILGRHDVTNDDDAYTRNYLRHEVMPRLNRINSAAARHMSEAALRAREEGEFLDALADERLAGLRFRGGAAELPGAALADAPAALRPRMLLRLLDRIGVPRRDVTAGHLMAVSALASGKRQSAQLDLPHNLTVRREGNWLRFVSRASGGERVPLPIGETIYWGNNTICITEQKDNEKLSGKALLLSPDAAEAGLFVGRWDPRRRMKLPGRPERGLKRLFEETGTPPERRDCCAVIYAGDEVAAAEGLGTAERFLPRGGEALCVIIQKNDSMGKTSGEGESYG